MQTLTRAAGTGPIDLAVRSSGPVVGTPVLLIHGMGGDHHTWRGLARLLRATGRTVISLDQRGHGRSSRSSSYLLNDFRDDVNFVLDDLGIDHVDVVGHSLGAQTAMRVAMAAPDRIGKLALEEIPPMPRNQDDLDEHIAPFTGIVDRVLGLWTVIRYPGPVFRFDHRMSEIVTRQFDVVDTAWWEALSTITAPTLVISGGPRSFLPPRHLKSVAGALPDAQFVSIDAGHSVHRDRPEEFNARVVNSCDRNADKSKVPTVNPAHRQTGHTVRFEWGPVGAEAIAVGCDVAIVVDVLSFTTTLSVALDAGIEVLPYRPNQDTAAAYAESVAATLAVGRSVARDGQISLSPWTIRRLADPPERLVLPSPNGSAISYQLAESTDTVIGASLRTATAVAEWIAANHSPETTIAVIAAGERWPDGTLRPAIEDLWGAGAVLNALAESGWGDGFSPEARGAAEAWRSVSADHVARLRDCASGVELITAGYPEDVAIASELNASTSVPVLHEDRYTSLG